MKFSDILKFRRTGPIRSEEAPWRHLCASFIEERNRPVGMGGRSGDRHGEALALVEVISAFGRQLPRQYTQRMLLQEAPCTIRWQISAR